MLMLDQSTVNLHAPSVSIPSWDPKKSTNSNVCMCSTRNVSRNGSCSTISTAPSVTERITSVSNVRLLVTGYGWYECFCLLFGFIGFIFMRWWSSIFWVWRGAFFLFFCFLYDGIIVMIDEIYASQWILECL